MIRQTRFVVLFALLSLVAQIAHAQYAPVQFWNVTNWHTADDFMNFRYPDADTAIRTEWSDHEPVCGVRGETISWYQLDDTYAFPDTGYPYFDGTWSWHYHLKDCQAGIGPAEGGPYDGGVVARRYVQCLGNPDRYEWYYSVRGLPPDGCASANDNKGGRCCTNSLPPEDAGSVGDPINAGTGNKYEIKNEYRGTGPYPLDFTWTYNSTGGSDIGTPEETILGFGRTHTYQRRIRVFTDGTITTAFVARPDGNTLMFNKSGTSWIPASNLDGILTATFDGNNNVTSWTYRSLENETESYNASGVVQSLTDSNGNTQTVSYDASGRIANVADVSGRRLVFGYNASNRLSQLTTPEGGVLQFSYDTADNLQTVTYADTKSVTYFYSEAAYSPGSNQHLLTGVQDEKGIRYSTTSYDGSGHATSTYLASNVDLYTIDYGSSTVVTWPLGKTRSYGFQNVLGRILSSGVTESCNGCTARSSAYTYSAIGRLASVTDFAGTTSTYTQDPVTGLETQRTEGGTLQGPDACPAGSTYYSDTYGAPCTGGSCWANSPFPGSTDATVLGYPGQYYSCKVPGPPGAPPLRTVQTDWNTIFRKPTERRTLNATSALIGKSNWTYNTRGQALTQTQTDPANSATRTTTTTYCEQADLTAGTCPLLGLVKSVNGPRTDVSDVTTYTYYQTDDPTCVSAPTTCPHRKGDLWKATNAAGKLTTFTKYDGAGRLLSLTDPNGVVTDMTYGPRGWLTMRAVRGTNNAVTTDDAITNYAYDNVGQVTQVTQPGGAYVGFTYDAAHRLTDIRDNFNNTIHYTLDNAGNRIKDDTKDPAAVLKRSVLRVYNQLGQLQTSANADATPNADYTYDANGNPDHRTDGLGRLTDSDYDPLNRLSHVLQDSAGVQANTNYAYDARDRLTQVTDPQGLNTIYQYDGLDNLTRLTSPDTGITNYTYDAAGNRKIQTDARNIAATYSYDVLNRLTAITYPTTALNTTFTYDVSQSACLAGETFGVGRLTQFTDGSGSTQLCYDRFGNLVRKKQTVSGQGLIITYAYDLAGRLTQISTPKSTLIKYTRDAAGRITKVNYRLVGQTVDTTAVSNVSYYPYGPVKSITYGNGRVLNRSYDQDYVVSSVLDAGSGGLDLAFGRDVLGNLTQSQTGAVGNKYVYDGLNRLTGVNDLNNALIAAYTYDATGNRKSKQVGGSTQVYTYPLDSHHLIDIAGTARSYDAAGNTTAVGTNANSFIYNDTGRMSELRNAGVQVKQYNTNARGERVRKYHGTIAAEKLLTIYDESGHIQGDYDSTLARVRELIWMDDLPVGVLSGTTGTLAYLEPDHLGTPRAAIDATRNVAVWKWPLLNDAFGESAPQTDPDGDSVAFDVPLRFPGQRADAESGLSYNYFRDYEAGIGRYIESDPSGLRGGVSTFGYVYGNPLGLMDPNGLVPIEACGNPANAAACAAAGIGVFGAGLTGSIALSKLKSRGCPDTLNPCPWIEASIREAMAEIEGRINAMWADHCDLYNQARSEPNPLLRRGCNDSSWDGHKEQIEGLQNRLKLLIELAYFFGCNIPSGAYRDAWAHIPYMPL